LISDELARRLEAGAERLVVKATDAHYAAPGSAVRVCFGEEKTPRLYLVTGVRRRLERGTVEFTLVATDGPPTAERVTV
jgi:hypothetical protein